MAHQSIYRSLCRLPLSDVHHVAEHIGRPDSSQQPASPSRESDWTARRKARPLEKLLPATLRWIAALPSDIELRALSAAFPRIVNAICALWATPDELARYLADLLIDKRGGRRGFSRDVYYELHALNAYHQRAHPGIDDAWGNRNLVN